MTAKVSGTVMEVHEEFDDKKNKLATVTAMVFQKGEKTLLKIKNVPNELVQEGEKLMDMFIRVSMYNFNGNSGMSCHYVGLN